MRFLLSTLLLVVLVSCSSDDRSLNYPEVMGLVYSDSQHDFVTTYNALRSEIQHSDFRIHKEINFKNYAESNGKRSRETRMILFSNPSLEAPLIQNKPEIGLEFPSRVLTYEDRNKYALVAYNKIEYLGRIYEVSDLGAIQNLEASLAHIVSNSTGNTVLDNGSNIAGRNHMTIPSANSYIETFNKLRNMIADDDKLTLLETIDHQENARLVGVDISPNRLLLLTTGDFEANLIDKNQLSSVDLPIRILVWEDENNKTQISYQNLDTLIYRHDMNSNIEGLENVKNLLARMVIEAAN